jgi:hypothetical protein
LSTDQPPFHLELPLDEAHRKRLRRPRIIHDFGANSASALASKNQKAAP